ncbi:hypothetical protein Tco_0983228 [Tanacetum coccineum]
MMNRDAKDCQGGNKGRDEVGRQGGEEKGTMLVCYLAGSGDRAHEGDVQLFPLYLKFGDMARMVPESVICTLQMEGSRSEEVRDLGGIYVSP